MSTHPKALIFGATGAVATATALAASQHFPVVLAMRDPTKPLDPRIAHLPRVAADLTDAASVAHAAASTHATAVFLYVVSADLAPALAALHGTRVSRVVLLSSFGLQRYASAADAQEGNVIEAKHARAEVALAATGLPHTCVRPAYFASNVFQSAADMRRGEVLVPEGDPAWDFITPEDIGAVCAARLGAEGLETMPLAGPRRIRMTEAWEILKRETGLELKITKVPMQRWLETREGMPQPVRDALGEVFGRDWLGEPGVFETSSGNVRKYAGKEPMQFDEWVRIHKGEILAVVGK